MLSPKTIPTFCPMDPCTRTNSLPDMKFELLYALHTKLNKKTYKQPTPSYILMLVQNQPHYLLIHLASHPNLPCFALETFKQLKVCPNHKLGDMYRELL